MVNIPLSRSDYFRNIAKEARIRTKNRYFEQNPVLTEDQAALIARPGLKRFLSVGAGPIRGTYSQTGSFSDALFVVSDDQLYRVDTDETVTSIGTLPSASQRSFVSMAATSNIGETPAYLFVASGSTLMCYMEDSYALGTISGTPANGDVVRVDLMYYQFTNGSVDAGTPAGTSGNPWLVALGASAAEAWENLAAAFGATGVAGTSYSTALIQNSVIAVQQYTATDVLVRATIVGAVGNSIITTETGAAIAWGAATLAGGGDPSWFEVPTPDDVGIVSVGYIASHVVCVPSQGQGINGRFYWIDPGETTIDPLDFATAERAPDPISGVVVFGDQFWLPGSNTTEVFYFTGDADVPVRRMQGVVFDRGSWEGTAVQVKDSMIIVDNEGGVFQIAGGVKRISRPDIEERIRKAIQYQASQIV
jgi:hypothetical protein